MSLGSLKMLKAASDPGEAVIFNEQWVKRKA
jgi:hypothetical protein